MMFIKLFLLLAVLLITYGFAVILLRRLSDSHDKLAALHEQMARNDAQLREQMHRISEAQAAQAAANVAQDTASTSPPPNPR